MNRRRAELIDRLESSGQDLIWSIEQLSEDERMRPTGAGEWTVHQIASHLRDTEQQVFLRRTEWIFRQEHPVVENFDQEEWDRVHYDPSEPLRKIFSEFRAARRKVVKLLRSSSEKDWKNWAVHPEYGRISLDWLTLHDYYHTCEHIAQIGRLRDQITLEQLNGNP